MPKRNQARRRQATAKANATEARSIEGQWHRIDFGRGAPSSAARVNESNALALTAVYAAINRIATDLSTMSRGVFERGPNGTRSEAREHPVSDLLTIEPNEEMSAQRFVQTTMGHVLGWGNGLCEIERTRGGEAFKIWPLDPRTCRAARSPYKKMLVYELDGGRANLWPDKVLHFAGLGFDGINGYSPIRLFRRAIGLGLSVETFGLSYFDNGSVPKGVIEHPGKLGLDGIRNLRESIADVHQGVDNAHRPIILEEGASWKPTTLPPEEAQFLSTRQFQVVEIARIYGVPPHKIGDFSQSHLSNIENANIDYLMTTLLGWVEMIESEWNRKLFTREERRRYYAEHNMTSFLRGNMGARAAFYKELAMLGVLTPNEIRRRENLDPIGPEGDQHLIPLNMGTLAKLATAPAPGAASP